MKSPKNRGFIVKIVLIIIAIVLLKYVFDVDVLAWLKTPTAHKIIDPLWNFIKVLYNWIDSLVERLIA